MSVNGQPVQYPEDKSAPAWVYPLAALFYALLVGVGFHTGWHVVGLLW